MNSCRKITIESRKGITLIAMVITIIVLLILAGISISMLSGENSILKRAVDSKTNTERQSVVEQARMDVLGYQVENKSGEIKKSQLKNVLDKYFIEVPNELPDGDNLFKLELDTQDKYGNYKIKVSELFDGIISEENQLSDLEKLKLYLGDANNYDSYGFIDNDELGIKAEDILIIDSRYSGIEELAYVYFTYKEKIYRGVNNDDTGIWTNEVSIANVSGNRGLCKLDNVLDILITYDFIYSSENYVVKNNDLYGTIYEVEEYDDEDTYIGKAYFNGDGDRVIISTAYAEYDYTISISNMMHSIGCGSVLDTYFKNEELEYISQDNNIVTVNGNGDVTGTAREGGNTKITIIGKTTGKKLIIPVTCHREIG